MSTEASATPVASGAPRLGAVVLAAGAGSRIGHRPKALLELDGRPLIHRLLEALQSVGVARPVVVLGHHADRIGAALRGFDVRTVRNPDPEAGIEGSQRLGLAAIEGPVDAVVLALADQPLVGAAELQALAEAWGRRAAGIEALHPRVEGERGNPVVVSARVRDEVLGQPPPFGCRDWQRAHRSRVAAFDTVNPNYRIDIDRPEDLERFERTTGRAIAWPSDGGIPTGGVDIDRGAGGQG